MRKVYIFIYISVLLGCTSTSQIPDSISFYDSSNCHYSFESLDDDFLRCTGIKVQPRIILLLTNTLENQKYLKQMSLLKDIDMESENIIIVRGFKTGSDKSGYYISQVLTKELLGLNSFKLYLYNQKLSQVINSKSPKSLGQIKVALSEAS